MKKKLKWAIAVFICVPVLIVAFQVTRKMLSNRRQDVIEAAVPVVSGNPVLGTLEESIMYPGTLKPERMVTVLPKTPGKLDSLHVREGDRVEENQVLASIEKQAVRLQMEQALAGYQAAQAQYQKAIRGVRPEELQNAKASFAQAEQDLSAAETNLARTKRLMDAGTISQAKYEEAEQAFQNAKTNLENARRSMNLMEEGASREDLAMARANADGMKAQYELAELQLENTEVKAPLSGMIGKIMVDEGSMVGPQVPILVIIQDDPVFVEIPVPEKYYGKIMEGKNGIEARIYPAAYPNADAFIGKLKNVAEIIDPQSRTFTVEIAVENPDNKLRPGMYVNVEIVLNKVENALTVPESSLVFRNDRQVVFVVSNKNKMKAMMKPVTIGLRKNGIVEINGGLKKDDQIIIKGNAFLEDGQLIELVDG